MNYSHLVGKTIKVEVTHIIDRRAEKKETIIEDVIITDILEPEKGIDKRYEVFFSYGKGSIGFAKYTEEQLKSL